MKFKPNQTRTYDGEGFKRRAACLCFRNDKEDEVSCVALRSKLEVLATAGGEDRHERAPFLTLSQVNRTHLNKTARVRI